MPVPRSFSTAVSHPAISVGFTHASIVMPVVRSSGLLVVSGTVTQSSTPSNRSARPNLPATRAAPRIVPFRPVSEESTAAVPLASSNPKASTRPSLPSQTDLPTPPPGPRTAPAGRVGTDHGGGLAGRAVRKGPRAGREARARDRARCVDPQQADHRRHPSRGGRTERDGQVDRTAGQNGRSGKRTLQDDASGL